MQVEIKVPVLPESVSEGTLGDWHKQVGDSVAVDENIVDLETDKVVLEIVAHKAGVIESIAFASGDTVKNGDVLGMINTEAAVSTRNTTSSAGCGRADTATSATTSHSISMRCKTTTATSSSPSASGAICSRPAS